MKRERSTQELTQRAYLNMLATGLDYGVKTVVTLIINPILVVGLGSALFGVWQILSRLMVYISPTGIGPTQALKWLIASKQSSDDDEAKRRDVGSALLVWLMFMPLVIVLGALVVWLAPNLTNVPPDLYTLTRISALLLVFNFVLSGVALLPDVILRGMNLDYKRMGLRGLLAVLGGILMAAAVYLGYGLVGLAAVQIIITALTGFLFWRVARQNVPWLGIAKPRQAEAKQFASYSLWFFSSVLVITVLNFSDVVILGAVASATAVTTYVLTYYPAQMTVTLTAIVVGGVLPGLGGIIGEGNLERAARVRSEIMATSWLLATVMGATIIIWNHSFVTLWVGEEQFAGLLATLLMALYATQLILTRNDYNIIDLTLDIRKKTLLSVIAAAASVGLAALLARTWGIPGLVCGLIVGQAVVTLVYPVMIGSYLSIPLFRQLRAVIRPLLTVAGIFTIAYSLGKYFLAQGWLQFGAGVLITLPVASVLAWFLGLNGAMRRRLLSRVDVALSMFRKRLMKGKTE